MAKRVILFIKVRGQEVKVTNDQQVKGQVQRSTFLKVKDIHFIIFKDNKEDCLTSVESEIQKRRGGMSHMGMTHGRRSMGMTHGNSGESARTCVHCELPENLVRCHHFFEC